jgi:hypothetical protein
MRVMRAEDETAMASEKPYKKRAPRVALGRAAVLANSQGAESDVVIVNISAGGFRVKMQDPPPVGELVTLLVERGVAFAGQIRWVLGEDAGGVFLNPAAEHDFRRTDR